MSIQGVGRDELVYLFSVFRADVCGVRMHERFKSSSVPQVRVRLIKNKKYSLASQSQCSQYFNIPPKWGLAPPR